MFYYQDFGEICVLIEEVSASLLALRAADHVPDLISGSLQPQHDQPFP